MNGGTQIGSTRRKKGTEGSTRKKEERKRWIWKEGRKEGRKGEKVGRTRRES
jgi:hypothetical protein